MPSPFIAEKGVIRLSPLEKAVAARSTSTADGNGADANRATANPNVAGNKSKLPEGVTEEQVAEAAAKAEAGDQTAIDWLKTLGIVAGVAGTGYAVHRILKSRSAKTTPQSMGADNIATDAAAPNATSAVAKRKPTIDLYVDRSAPDGVVRAGYLPAPNKQLETGQPPRVTLDQMKALATPGPNYPVGKTKAQIEADLAYAQKAAQDKDKARFTPSGGAKKNRAYDYGDIIKGIRRVF